MASVDINENDIHVEIKNFAIDILDDIFQNYSFEKDSVRDEFISNDKNVFSSNKLSRRFVETNAWEPVIKAVQTTRFLMRGFLQHFFLFTIDKDDFRAEVKLLWAHWMTKREQVFVKVIDTLAIVAEAFAFSDHRDKRDRHVSEAVDWFVEWFRESLFLQFYKCCDWDLFCRSAEDWYGELYLSLGIDARLECSDGYEDFVCNDKVVTALRNSPVLFPVPACKISRKMLRSLFSELKELKNAAEREKQFNKSRYRSIVFMRLKNEVLGIPLSESFNEIDETDSATTSLRDISLEEEPSTIDSEVTQEVKIRDDDATTHATQLDNRCYNTRYSLQKRDKSKIPNLDGKDDKSKNSQVDKIDAKSKNLRLNKNDDKSETLHQDKCARSKNSSLVKKNDKSKNCLIDNDKSEYPELDKNSDKDNKENEALSDGDGKKNSKLLTKTKHNEKICSEESQMDKDKTPCITFETVSNAKISYPNFFKKYINQFHDKLKPSDGAENFSIEDNNGITFFIISKMCSNSFEGLRDTFLKNKESFTISELSDLRQTVDSATMREINDEAIPETDKTICIFANDYSYYLLGREI